ncbi:molybdenum cofactor sulfurase isoform X2 [Pristis pectinata]|uniref:molybdenum cofactor sulfurase isoform X2 n=1 Tax=Pristis pectinata TaxID=685728 RepID=UPI00223D9D16|nr:molybdenum cofactor sulfurase isoform X2 [Pristis pectinata]
MERSGSVSLPSQEWFQETFKQYGYEGQIGAVRAREFGRLAGNPHSGNVASRLTHDTIDHVRYRILQLFNTSPEEYTVIFTSGCTAALKLVAENFQWTCAEHEESRSRFCHLTDNHTSVVGMRGLSVPAGALTLPINLDEIHEDKNILHEKISMAKEEDCHIHHLFCYPAQSNFSGTKYPLSWIRDIRSKKLYPFSRIPGTWNVLVDAASFVSTSPLDLSLYQADFIPISFYKIFGFPTGLGALLVKNENGHMLGKKYFGGGTAASYLSTEDFYVPRQSISERFEDGTVSFLDIIAVNHGFNALEKITGGMQNIMLHTFSLARYTYIMLSGMLHANERPVARIYSNNEFETPDIQGPIINFNILDENGDIVGYAKVDKLANLHNIYLRTGCFCNTGGCQRHIGISNEDVKKNLKAGHVCGDALDLIDGRPTGSVRISYGYMSTFDDAQTFLKFVIDCFVKQPVCFDKDTLSKLNLCRTMKEKDELWAENLANENVISVREVSSEIAGTHSRGVEVPLYQNFSDNPSKWNKNPGSSKLISNDNELVTLTNIYLYPIKSCAAVEVKKWPIGKHGLLYDRVWMIVNHNGIYLNQKQEPKLCLIHPHIDLEQGIMTISAEGMDPIMVPLEEEAGEQYSLRFCQTKVCGDRVKGLNCGEKVAGWISTFLGRQSYLFRQSSDFQRVMKKHKQGQSLTQSPSLSLVNEAQYLLVNRASILHLKEQILQRGGTCDSNSAEALTTKELIHRFRANLVISTMRPYEEDDWAEVVIDGVSYPFQIVGLCSRCQMICINQDNGKRSKEPLQTLSSCKGRKMTFGVYLLHQLPATLGHSAFLTVGSQVFVKTKEENTITPAEP